MAWAFLPGLVLRTSLGKTQPSSMSAELSTSHSLAQAAPAGSSSAWPLKKSIFLLAKSDHFLFHYPTPGLAVLGKACTMHGDANHL